MSDEIYFTPSGKLHENSIFLDTEYFIPLDAIGNPRAPPPSKALDPTFCTFHWGAKSVMNFHVKNYLWIELCVLYPRDFLYMTFKFLATELELFSFSFLLLILLHIMH